MQLSRLASTRRDARVLQARLLGAALLSLLILACLYSGAASARIARGPAVSARNQSSAATNASAKHPASKTAALCARHHNCARHSTKRRRKAHVRGHSGARRRAHPHHSARAGHRHVSGPGTVAGLTGAGSPAEAGATAATGTAPTPAATGEVASRASEPLRLFASTSFFNEPLPAAPPLASNSAQLVAHFNEQVAHYGGHAVINTTEWSTPVYVVGAGAPTVALVGESSICPRPEGIFSGFQAQIEAVPMPANAIPASGSDKEVIVWQPSTGHLWELWRVLNENGHWTACWGGEIPDAYTSEGVLPAPFGAGASGLSLLGGQIHLEDLEHGVINHALEVLMPDTANGAIVWPADRTDGESNAADAIPEGTRFRLNPNLNLAALNLSPAALEIATAIQRYGLIVADTAGSVALSAQDTTPLIQEGKPNPYNTLLPKPYDELDAVPWSQLEAVSPNFHG